ncbi:cytochrome P450 [Acuticoccus mangrovi]|uniref:Cytochrome P450 n=1 Tax=Acuticoccus mangrovi TaxID=2796142 RepID=A0A934IPE1_9HYPH|nr:cytochrome P450 [Acuticoccus mangrovi]MBJ3775620.1 cytochrome P450 [Acuticoccus mangrovi]
MIKSEDKLPSFGWDDKEYRDAPVAFMGDLAKKCPFATTETGLVVLKRNEARHILRRDLPISVYHIPEEVSPYLAERTKEPLLTRHGPEHAELRKILTKVFRTRVIETLRPRIHDLFVGLLEPLLERGEGDLVSELFHPFPARVLAPMLGLPLSDIDMVSAWVDSSARWTNMFIAVEELAEVETAWRALEAYLLDLLRERREDLKDDIFSELIREMEGHRELEVVGIAMELTRAGMDTTRRQLENTTLALLENPAEWAKLTADPEGVAPSVVEEGMRYASITHHISRQAVDETEFGGMPAHKGEVATVLAMAVNRDEDVYEHPERFEVSREPSPHMTFGFGSHACVGAPLARMEMTEAFTILGNRVERFELIGDVPRGDVSLGLVPTKLPVRIYPKR